MKDLHVNSYKPWACHLSVPYTDGKVGLFVFMPPTSKKLRGHIGLGLSVQSVSLSVSLSVCDA